ncbi:hypothetical protein IX51_00805 [uncultured archaeon]|nr:hypothetical protein IX51_00805 [uncultured archaeon]HKJ96830.1 DUF5611 family protein [Thermoplasmataceae archaeon]
MARQYPVKKGIKITPDYILEETKKLAESAEIKDEHVLAYIPGMKVVDLYTDGKGLFAETEADTTHKDFSQTIKLYNQLIENLTGYSSKERKKKYSKS